MNRVISLGEFDFAWFRKIKWAAKPVGRHGSHYRLTYKNIITAFDIECSTISLESGPQAFMYVWQWQFGNEYTVIGRTWDELRTFIKKLTRGFSRDQAVWVAVHNLSYEFQFLRGQFHFNPEDVFCMKSRKILTCRVPGVEFHCSYIHSNMSLKEYLKKYKAEHKKLDGGEFNYNIIRYPWTELKPREIEYAVNDVLGLVEAIEIQMQAEGDTIYTFPLTSTSYVRRKARKAMEGSGHAYIKGILPDLDQYELMREAFRGGNTHANRWYAHKILHNVQSWDRSSSYPDVMCNRLFPVRAFEKHDKHTDMSELLHMIHDRGRACLFRLRLWNVRLKDRYWPVPYLAKDKCRFVRNSVNDNGRIISADYLETSITDIDLMIILGEYDFDAAEPFDVYSTTYGELPKELTNLIKQLYKDKTELKGVEGAEIQYQLSKEQINAVYGMACQDPVKDMIEYIAESDELYIQRHKIPNNLPEAEKRKQEKKIKKELLEAYSKKAFLTYAWGVWTTAHARAALEEGIKIAGDDCVYVDTDSVKFLGEHSFDDFNKTAESASRKSGAYAVDKKGKTHFMGVFEEEQSYYEFATLGSKKYAYRHEEGGAMGATIAGVSKDVWEGDKLLKAGGGAELDRNGGLKAFLTPGFIFRDAGGVELIYNDNPVIQPILIDGHTLEITSNVVIKDSTYTLGITQEYRDLLFNIREEDLDIFDNIEV